MSEFKNMLKYLRERADLSQADLAKKLGIAKSTISMYEIGKREPDFETMEAIADLFNVDMNFLHGKSGSENDAFNKTVPIPAFKNITPIVRKTFPLFDGIAAGEPRLMPDGVTLYVDATVDVQADYVLKVHGDSMIGARINDGDYVFVRQQPEVENGEIAAVAIGDEATLKRFYKYGDMVVLRGENPEFKEMTFTGPELEQVRILGKAVAFQSDVR